MEWTGLRPSGRLSAKQAIQRAAFSSLPPDEQQRGAGQSSPIGSDRIGSNRIELSKSKWNGMSHSNVICPICTELCRSTDPLTAGSCGHAFHEECLKRWREQSRTCPICRCQDATFFQLYLNFEESPQSGLPHGGGSGSGSGSGGGRDQSQGHSSSSNSSNSSLDYEGIMREYENLLYETGVYQEEIKYLNEFIGTLRNS
ncbi:E3 ubiquitin-protein ligase RNF128 [Drosophila ficusphila]|uniref:E3 ubiquitin-protein ligase RNF128 n=1 Tax=Drosophila ficusphila TaxID=30025 RepID=UPI0007E6E2D4|nr:E3 ubiquitin-protein ligase RNF128 [Drosophila ficusphila]